MFSRAFLQDRPIGLLKLLRDRFPTSVGLIMPSEKNDTRNTKTWTITTLVTETSHKDNPTLSYENMEYKIVDIFMEDIDQLKTDNPTAYIVKKNFKSKVDVYINGKVWKIREESNPQGFETMVRFLCERSTMS